MHRNRLLSVLLVFVVLPFSLLSCGGDDGSGPETFSVSISPVTAEVPTGGSTTLTARVTDGSGATVTGRSFTWSSSNETVATVDGTGTVQGLTAGQTTVTATTDIDGTPTAATATITVIQVPTTVNVTPATGSLVVGETLQFTAEVLDGVGESISGASVTWSSSDPAVVTVDANGLATGVGEGTATISAMAGTASATATTEVAPARGPLEPQEDITLSGEVNVTTFTVPAGVTVTVAEDLMLNASETVDIAGTIVGDCVDVNIQAVGVVTLSGALNTPCAGMAETPGVTILSGSGFTLQDAVITTSGYVLLVSDASADAGPAFAAAASALVPAPCFLNNSRIEIVSAEDGADGQPDGEDGYDGHDITVSCGRDRAVLSGSTLQAADGGNGGEGFSSNTAQAANGGHGGHGGGVFIRSDVGISFTTSASYIQAGSGGDGGPGEAQSEDAIAFGGDGGHAGKILIEIPANAGEIFVEDLRFIDITAGSGGMGGTAAATGDFGEDATDAAPAENGGNATATGGTGGDNYPEANKAVLGDLIPRGLAAGFLSADFHGGASGTGGMASVVGGQGGKGSKTFPDGGNGGTMTANGGPGGKLTVLRNGNEGTYPGTPGNGGLASFHEGWAGDGYDDCVVGDIKPGGKGGTGGNASGGDGEAGQGFDGSNKGTSNGVLLSSISRGGDGGDGDEVGIGGDGGTDGIVAKGTRQDDGVSFEKGEDGDPCETPMDIGVSVLDDPIPHDPFALGSTMTMLTVILRTDGVIEITGPGLWVTVDGVVSPDGSFTTTGTGTVAGITGVTVTFDGTLRLDEDGRVAGIQGTLVWGANNELPEDPDTGQKAPVTYTVDGNKKPEAP